ncbi:MAG: hypothetical protein ACJ77Z_07710 [Thermoleophilaceae bacterium]|jgi:hypothetical protein
MVILGLILGVVIAVIVAVQGCGHENVRRHAERPGASAGRL